MIRVGFTFHPLGVWPGPRTPAHERRPGAFRATYADTLGLLEWEIGTLDGTHAVVEIDAGEEDIRRDGLRRAHARPSSPGVAVSFTCRWGPIRLAADRFTDWRANLRAIALGLGDLRRLDRYGLTRTGEQYRGFLALEAGNGKASAERGRELIRRHGGVRHALRATHPDAGGDPADFRDVVAARAEAAA